MGDQSLRMVVSIYAHPELYPPTLNALTALSEVSKSIHLVYLNTRTAHWQYPVNVEQVPVGEPQVVNFLASAPLLIKLKSFYRYTMHLREVIKRQRPHYLLAYDAMAFYASALAIKGMRNPPRLWYHSHDVNEPAAVRRFSLTWLAQRAERKNFAQLSIFSLPSMERLQFFNMNVFTGKFFFLPNYPALAVFGKRMPASNPDGCVKLIYQGTISDEHGLEELIAALPHFSRRVELFIIGFGPEHYKERLKAASTKAGVQEQVTIHPPVPYMQLVDASSAHHIGIAINIPKNIIYSTGGTASNKIYEYAACGLPVLYFDAPQYTQHLGEYEWAVPCNLQRDNIIKKVQKVAENYPYLSAQAKKDFMETLHYEKIVAPIISFLSVEENRPAHGTAN